MSERKATRRAQWALVFVILLGVVVRVPWLAQDRRITNDLEFFRAWIQALETRGLVSIYQDPRVNYPPVLLYAFAFFGELEKQTHLQNDTARNVWIKLLAVSADIAIAIIVAVALWRRAPYRAVIACAAFLLNPAIWFTSALWGQLDSVYILFLVGSLLAASRNHFGWAWVLIIVAVGTKPQSVALVPLLALGTWRQRGVWGLARAIAFALLTAALLGLPWLATGHWSEMINAVTLVKSPRVVVSAYNFWYLLKGGDVHTWSSLDQPFEGLGSYQIWGWLLGGVSLLVILVLNVRRGQVRWALSAALCALSFFLFFTQVRERYLLPVLALLLMAAAGVDERESARGMDRSEERILWTSYFLLSVTCLFNLVTIAPFAPPLWSAVHGNLVAATADTSTVIFFKNLSVIAAGLNVAVWVWLMLTLGNFRSRDTRHTPPSP